MHSGRSAGVATRSRERVSPFDAQANRSRTAPAWAQRASGIVITRGYSSAVFFEPGPRTAWHTHPRGQVLIVTAATGRVQRWGGAVDEIHTGDVVWIPPGAKHWHGAGPTTAMTHIAIAENRDGKGVDWLEKVSDQQYAASTGVRDAAAGTSPLARSS